MGRVARLLGWPFVAIATSHCASPLADAQLEFQRGRYDEAKQTLSSIEPEAARYTDDKRAVYALYRGLTLAALGDTRHAAVWLREAKAIESVHPGSLSVDDSRRLAVALQTVDDS